MADLTLPPVSDSPSQIRMVRLTLEDLPDLEIPTGYHLRTYQPGDEENWAALLRAAFGLDKWTVETIDREFLSQAAFRPERAFFTVQGEEIVAAACAWEKADPEWGYVHWVGVSPEHRGKRLGRLITLATLHQFREEGKRAAYLDTDDFRPAACATYLSLGFEPDLRNEAFREMWSRAEANIGARQDIVSGLAAMG